MKTIITTDSGSNPRNISNMVPCIITDGNGKNYCDTRKISSKSVNVITNSEVLDKSINGEKLRTSGPAIGEYVALMSNYLTEGNNVVHLSMSSGISAGSLHAAIVARDILNDEYKYNQGKVTVIDTLTGGAGGTVINDYANDLVNQGLSNKEIINELEEVKKRLLTTFYISKADGFVRSGRSPLETAIATKLPFKYRVNVNSNGKLFPKGIYRGSVEKSFMKFLKETINDKNINDFDPEYFALLITRLKEINMEEAIDYIKSFNYFNEKNVKVEEFYGVINSYGVLDQVGLGLIKKKN